MFITNIYNQPEFFHVPEKIRKIIKTGGFLRNDHEYPDHHPRRGGSRIIKI